MAESYDDKDTRLVGSVSLDKRGHGFLGKRRADLLERIDQTGSISRAAKDLKISYKAAWDAVHDMNNLADHPLVERWAGGRHGGGTQLTDHGRRAIELFRTVEMQYRQFLDTLNKGMRDFDRYQQFMRRLAMKTSARNQFYGRITSLRQGAVNSRVIVGLGEKERIVAVVTNSSVEEMGLEQGAEVYALVKSSSVIVVPGGRQIRTSAGNCLCGTIIHCQEGAVNGEVTIELTGGKAITAIITNESIHTLGLAEGTAVCALVKASSVILAVND